MGGIILISVLLSLWIFWILLKLRLAPRKLMQIWFIFTVVIISVCCNVSTLIIDLMRRISLLEPLTCAGLCCKAVTFFMHKALILNPQIRIVVVEDSEYKRIDFPSKSMVLLNHTSFFDSFLFTASCPYLYVSKTRTFMKDSLRNLPLFGAVFQRIGHFPVYFQSEGENEFSVNKEKQAEVHQRVTKHIRDLDGGIALFPEGQMNRNPRILTPFRHGSFNYAIEHMLPIYYFIAVNNDQVWPCKGLPTGAPVTIYIKIGKIKVDLEKMDAKKLSTECQEVMQEEVNKLFELSAKEGNLPFSSQACSSQSASAAGGEPKKVC